MGNKSWRDRGGGGHQRRAESTWRKPRTSTPAASHWQKTGTTRGVGRRRIKLAAFALLSMGLLAALIAWILFVPRPVPMLVFAVTGFQHPLPPNALAREDAALLQRTFDVYPNVQFSADTDDYGSHDDLLGALKMSLAAATAGGPSRDAVVVYLSTHGIVSERNEACLLLPSSDQRSDRWLPLRDVLNTIAEGSTAAGSGRGPVNVLLLLDCGRLPTDATIGYSYASFIDRVAHAIESAAIPHLAVITSTGFGQHSYLLPEQGCSLFGYFVAAGLRGGAQGDNHQVTLHGLHRYLQSNVAAFATYYRGRQQQPAMFPPDAPDFKIAHVTQPVLPETQPLVALDDEAALDDYWTQAADLQRRGACRFAPRLWADLLKRLVRLESLRFAGEAYKQQYETTHASIRADLAKLQAYRLLDPTQCDSATMAAQMAPSEPEQRTEARARYLAWRQSLSADPPADPPVPRPELPSWQAAQVAWDAVVTEGPTESVWQSARELVAAAQPATKPPVGFAEVQFLDMLQAGLLGTPARVAGAQDPSNTDLSNTDPSNTDLSNTDVRDALAKALRTQALAERTSVPGDVRGYRWLTAALQQSDPVLRAGWDALFLADARSLELALAAWQRLAGDDGQAGWYREQLQIDQLVQSAYALRDEAWHELPFLIDWVTRHRQRLSSQANLAAPELEKSERLTGLLEQLIRSTHQLGKQLDLVPTNLTNVMQASELIRFKDEVALVLRPLQTAFRDECRALWVENARDVTSIAAMGDVLSVPLVPGDVRVRNDLRRRYYQHRLSGGDAVAELQAMAVEAASAPSTIEPQDRAYLDWLVPFQRSVILALMDRQAVIEDGSIPNIQWLESPSITAESAAEARARQLQYLAEVGGELRSQLLGLDSIGDRLMGITARQLQEASRDGSATRVGLSQADRLMRPVNGWRWPAAIGGGVVSPAGATGASQDPCRALLAHDVHFLLLDRAARRTADAWGNATPPGIGSPDDLYFSRLARGLVQAAAGVYPSAVKYREQTLAQVESQVSAFRSWRLTASGLQLAGDERSVPHQTKSESDLDLPAGRGSLFVRDAAGTPIPLQPRVPPRGTQPASPLVRIPAELRANEPIAYRIPLTADIRGATLMEASMFFRGHWRTASFLVDTEDNATVSTFVRQPEPPPRILVEGDTRQISQIVFVLDCSASMRFLHDQEGRARRRLDLAIEAVTSILKTLNQSNYHIGLVLYGHRAGWRTSRDIQHRSPAATPDLHPGSDVEVAVPLTPVFRTNRATGRLEDMRHELYAALADLRPYGETPLYYAITEAMDQFDARTPGARTVIVITDGVNTQSADPKRNTRRDKSDVLARLNNPETRARVDIIGLHEDPSSFASDRDRNDWFQHEKPRWEGGQKSDLQQIAAASGGRFHDVTRMHTLRQVLRDSLRLTKYFVRDPQGNTTRGIDLGQAWEPSARDVSLPEDFEVGVEGESQAVSTVRLEGGEALRLVYNTDTGRLEHQRFSDELAGQPAEIRRGREILFHVAPHIPRLQGNNLSELLFRVSVQNGDASEFSARPIRAWAEIQPLTPGARVATPPLISYDVRFEPGQPVPVLLFQLAGWPAAAERAEMKVWFEMPANDQSGSQDPWQEFAIPLDFQSQSTIEVLPEGAAAATLTVRSRLSAEKRVQVQVDEMHLDEAAVPFPLMIEASPAPDAVRRTFLNDSRRVKHILVYNDPEVLRAAQLKLRVLTQTALKDRWHAAGPLSVRLPLR